MFWGRRLGQKLIDLLNDSVSMLEFNFALFSWLLYPCLGGGATGAYAGGVGAGCTLGWVASLFDGPYDCGFGALLEGTLVLLWWLPFPSLPRAPPMLCPCWALSQEPSAAKPNHQLTGLLLPPPTARNNNGVNLILCPSLHLWYTSNLRQSSSFEQSDFIWYCFQKTKLDLTSQMTLYNSQAFKGIFRSANIWQQWKFSFQTAENNRHAEFSTIPSLERNNSLQGKPQEQKTGFF